MEAKEIVLQYIAALNKEDYGTAQLLVVDDFKFDGVLGQRNSAKEYFDDMRKMKLKYDVQTSISEGNDVVVFAEVDMGDAKLFNCLWYQLENGKIIKLKALFDPTPVFEKRKSNQ